MTQMTAAEFRANIEETNQLLRLTGNPMTPAEIDETVALYAQGMSPDEIVEEMMRQK